MSLRWVGKSNVYRRSLFFETKAMLASMLMKNAMEMGIENGLLREDGREGWREGWWEGKEKEEEEEEEEECDFLEVFAVADDDVTNEVVVCVYVCAGGEWWTCVNAKIQELPIHTLAVQSSEAVNTRLCVCAKEEEEEEEEECVGCLYCLIEKAIVVMRLSCPVIVCADVTAAKVLGLG